LHPFAVHFPVAFLLLGTAAVGLSLLWPHRNVLSFALIMMVLGALGATWAHTTGRVAAAEVRYVAQSVVGAVQSHQDSAGLMLFSAWFSAVATAACYFGGRLPGISLLARLMAGAACLFLLWTMQATLHTGSELTHTFFFGPNAPKPLPARRR